MIQKIYSNIQDAYGRAEAVYGPFEEWCSGWSNECQKRKFERITEFMKYSKICTISDNCDQYRFESGHGSTDGFTITGYGSSIILADGATIGFQDSRIFIDLDGLNKGKNLRCRDFFELDYVKGLGYDFSARYAGINRDYDFDQNSHCTAWVLKHGNMDYLKTDSSGRCPDGRYLSDGNPRCK